MKRLEAIRLVNWYHFADETLRLDGNCLFLGDNGSGKSTILDAVQLALVADLSEVRFNKAANEHSRRSLYGYVRHKLGSEDETRPGQVRFGRGACTSYVMLRFGDDRDPAAGLACGLVMEAAEADTNVSRSFFILPGALSEQVPAVDGGDLVRTAREFRALVREIPNARLWPDVGTYRDELRHRLGVLPESFHRLIVKALDFKPIGQVRQFVFDYLLDERPVDTAALQANLEHYKRLEAEAREAERRIAALEAICTQGERIAQERRTLESHRYMSLRAERELAEARSREVQGRIEAVALRQAELRSERERLEEQIAFLSRERDRLVGLLQQLPTFQQVRALELELERTRDELERVESADAEARRLLAIQTGALDLLVSQEARDLRRARPELFGEDELVGCAAPPETVARVRDTLLRDGALGGRDLGAWTRRLNGATDTLRLALLRLEEKLGAAKIEGRELEEERRGLERGRHRYPDGAEALLHLLGARLKGSCEPRPLCELIELPNERWRDAVEGYLNTRRFDVIVAPEDFPRALSLYERNKRAYVLPGRGEVFIAGVGLVDIERIQGLAPRCERRSLAEQVMTDDPLARAYCDFLLGDVICCDDEQELRRHRRAITDTVMVYQNHVARQTPREAYARHYVGQAARIRRMDEIGRRLGELSQIVIDLGRDLTWLKQAVARCERARGEAARLPDLVELAQRIPNLRVQAATLARQLDRIDRKEIDALDQERLALEAQRAERQEALEATIGELGGLEAETKMFAGQKVEAETARLAAVRALEDAFAGVEGERCEAYEQRYVRERAVRSAAEIRETFDRQYRNIESRIGNLRLELVRLKTEYANLYGFAGAETSDGYQEFADQRDLWRESRLPDYRSRIVRAKEEAIQQLTEDIIFRLRENLVLVRRQIDELNRALKEVPFGSERYQFTLDVAPEHRLFYDLIMDAGRFEKDSLFGNAALASQDTRRTLEDLFARLIEGEARQVKTELEARADYREYFTYDLRIHHADGTWSLYDRVAGDRSGGETQTPYYVAIFASMYRLYRQMSLDQRPTCGLVLLDEAFGKMDEPRIAAALRFARSLGLQLLLATPKERSELVAPWVETSLYIHKDPQTGMPIVLDFTKEFARDDAAATASADHAPQPLARGA